MNVVSSRDGDGVDWSQGVVVRCRGGLLHGLDHFLIEVLHKGDPRSWNFIWPEVHWAVAEVGCFHIIKVDPGWIRLVFHSQSESKPRDADFYTDVVTLLELLPQAVGNPLQVSLGVH